MTAFNVPPDRLLPVLRVRPDGSFGFLAGRLPRRAGAREKSKQLADGRLPADGLGKYIAGFQLRI
jgi:hypothetical protein